MGSFVEPAQFEIIDPYVAPEFFITSVPRMELAGPGCLRATFCVEKGRIFEARCFLVMPITIVPALARNMMRDAAEAHNAMQFKLDS